MTPAIKVLVVDDSAIVRKLLSDTLSAEPDIEVVGVAPDPYVARDKILRLNPDVLTLDIEMPRMDGLTFLNTLMQFRPIPVIVISSLGQASSRTALEALQLGAVDVLAKPGGPYSVGDLRNDLPQKVRAAARAHIAPAKPPAPTPVANPAPVAPRQPHARVSLRPASRSDNLILIGASTGGTEAIREILCALPENSPPIVIVQHIPAVFSRAFADRLDQICRIRVREAAHDDVVAHGVALIAPGNRHILLKRAADGFRVVLDDGPRVCYQRPAVDVLFESAAPHAGPNFTAALLTGMGSDGAEGLLKLNRAGAHTIAQDESSCVVFGMPREAIAIRAVTEVVPLGDIPAHILRIAAPTTEAATS